MTDKNSVNPFLQREAAIYARFSSHKQTEKSIKDQLIDCQEYALENNLIVRENNIFTDEARTGTNTNRDGFNEMIEAAKNKRFRYIIVWKMDRLSRNLIDSVLTLNDLKEMGVSVLSFVERTPIDRMDDPAYILMLNIQLAFNDYYSKELSFKTKRGMFRKVEEGNGNLGGVIPFGYCRSENPNRIYEVDDVEAAAVKEIFNKFLEGWPGDKILTWLKENNFYSHKRSKNKMEKSYISKAGLYNILRSKRYIGILEYNLKYLKNHTITIEDKTLQIIDEKIFEQVQEKLNARARKSETADYILSGKLYCARCGSRMNGMKGKKDYYYYICSKKYIKEKDKRCKMGMVKKDILENAISAAITRKFLSAALFSKLDKELVRLSKNTDSEKTRLKLINEYNDLKSEYDKKRDVFTKYVTSSNEFEKILAEDIMKDATELIQKIQLLKDQIEGIEEQKKSQEVLTVDDYKKYLEKVLSSFDETKKERMIQTFVKKIIVDDDYTVSISLKTLKDKEKPNLTDEHTVFLDSSKKRTLEYSEDDFEDFKELTDEEKKSVKDFIEQLRSKNNDDDDDNWPSGSSSSSSSNNSSSSSSNNVQNNSNPALLKIKNIMSNMVKEIKGWPNILREYKLASLCKVLYGEPNKTVHKPIDPETSNTDKIMYFVSSSGDVGLLLFIDKNKE